MTILEALRDGRTLDGEQLEELASVFSRVTDLENALESVRPGIGNCRCTHPAYGICAPCQAHQTIREVLDAG